MSISLWSESSFRYSSSTPKFEFSSEIDGASGTGSILVQSEASENNQLLFSVKWTNTTTTYSGELKEGNQRTEIGDNTPFKSTFSQNLGPMSLEYSVDTQTGSVAISCKVNDVSFDILLKPN